MQILSNNSRKCSTGFRGRQRTAESHEIELIALEAQAGLSLAPWREAMPFGSTCYAADRGPLSLARTGIVYKCTVAFNDPRNQIGRLSNDGTLTIREDLLHLWTSSGEETDLGCQQCGFRPACQGNHCPLERLNRGDKTCPSNWD
jgi:uncharacterized protein